MSFDAALLALEALPSDAPQQSLTLIAIGRMSVRTYFKVMWSRHRYGIDQRLQCLFVHVHFLFKIVKAH